MEAAQRVGAQDRSFCPRCKMPIRIADRSPDHEKENDKQILSCVICGHTWPRSAIEHGDDDR